MQKCPKIIPSATFKPTYRQKKRRINSTIRFGFGSNLCQRNIGDLVGVTVKTVQFDDLSTFENTKCKPLTVPIAVVEGHLAAIARKRHGKRTDHSRAKRGVLLRQRAQVLPKNVAFKTNAYTHHPIVIKKSFSKPNTHHPEERDVSSLLAMRTLCVHSRTKPEHTHLAPKNALIKLTINFA